MAIYIASYNFVHWKERDPGPEKTFYKVYKRWYVKNLIRIMIFDGIILEMLVVYLTSSIEHELDVV